MGFSRSTSASDDLGPFAKPATSANPRNLRPPPYSRRASFSVSNVPHHWALKSALIAAGS